MTRLSLTLDGNLRAFGTNESVTIGRADSNAFTIADGRVSGHHGEVVFADGCWTYYDRRSTNGSIVSRADSLTVVDGRTTRSLALDDGDVLLLGDADDPVRLQVALKATSLTVQLGDGTIVARHVVDDGSRILLGRGDGLLRLLRSVGAQTDPESVFDEVARFLLAQLPGADSVMLVAGRGSEIEPTFLLERDPKPPADDEEPPWPRALVAQATDENVAFLVVLEMPVAGVDSLIRLGVSSAIVAPLHHDQQSLGTLVVLGCSLTAADLELVSALAFQVASSFAVAGLIRRLRAVERRLREENRFLHERLERDETFKEIIGDSAAIRGVFEQMKLVKDTDA
ncbi:MAG: GAF domain-containing protein, partial [Myxococcota bacterium]